ncbi:MAG: hypothetical protein UZ22_OP11002000931 [Microgenomates bacterium OLB23]|nr:MAG: hypothetical protein UZ22_OP11002000931 [Microgenomates bacterium OLB23]
MRRAHLYIELVAAGEQISLTPPHIKPITRSGFTVIELGAYVQH